MATKKLPQDAFEFYFALGPGRGYQAVAEKYGCSKTTVANASQKEGWIDRIADREAQARARSDTNAVETLAELNDRHLKMLRVVQTKALEALRNMPLKSAMDAVRALDLTVKQERLILDDPAVQSTKSVEEIIKREYENWLVRTPDDAADDEAR